MAVDHTPATFAGRAVYVVKLVSGNDTTGFVVDTATGRILGGFAFGGEHDALEMASRWEYAIVRRRPALRPLDVRTSYCI